MIKKFEDFVNEGLWKSGIERSKSGEERLEDKVNSNIKDLKPVDIGQNFLISDKPLELNGSNMIDARDFIENYQDYFKKHDWRMLTSDDIDEIRTYFNQYKLERKLKTHRITDTFTDAFIDFPQDVCPSFSQQIIKVEELDGDERPALWHHSTSDNATGNSYLRGEINIMPKEYKGYLFLVKDKPNFDKTK